MSSEFSSKLIVEKFKFLVQLKKSSKIFANPKINFQAAFTNAVLVAVSVSRRVC
jgi:hypothetical protein